ncbi:MAG TPA: DUF861 domain-containing protein [Chromatiales bacterium]|nr:DUF861 domain-containing protein [Chromatiales bacterium]
MTQIEIIHNPDQKLLDEKGVDTWSVWEKSESSFPWTYEDTETCYFLEGEVIVRPVNGEAVKIGKGDLVTFPAGLSCSWEIIKPVRKYFCFEINTKKKDNNACP